MTQGSTSRDYAGSVIYENGSLKRILVEGGYIEGGTYYFYFNDHLGNVRAVIDGGNHNIQFNHYYPFGLPMAETTDGKQDEQPYKYNGKEFERKNGLNWMDYGARHYDAALGRFTTMDRFAEKYYSMSPYQYAGNNPVANVDINGDSIVILNYGYYQKQHMAMLIQSETGKWQYYSINGDNVYISGKFSGGRKADDIAVGEFYSPQEFMDSPYNTEGDGDNLSINSFGFSEGYLIPSSEVQDNTMRETFTNMSNDKEYDLLGNNCATTVQKVMKTAGLKTYNDKQQKYRVPDNRSFGESSFIVTHKNLHPIIPSVLYKSIIRHNPQGKTIHKTKK